MDWKQELQDAGYTVSDFTICMYRTGWAAFPAVVSTRIPHDEKVRERAEAFLTFREPIQVFPVISEPFPGKPRIDAECIDMAGPDAPAFSVEMGADWIRFYFRAPKDCGQSRDELAGQEPQAWRVVPRILAHLAVPA